MTRKRFIALMVLTLCATVLALTGLTAAQDGLGAKLYLPLVARGGESNGPPSLETRLTVLPTSGPPGSLVHVRGAGFGDSPCGINFYWDSLDGLGLGFAGVEEGEFAADLTIPEGAGQGVHTIIAQGLLFDVEFCGEPSGEEAEVEFTVTEAMPLITLDQLDATPGVKIMIHGAHFCNQPDCSDVTIIIGNRLAGQAIEVEPDGTFEVEIVVPGGYPIGLTPIMVSQLGADGAELTAYGELQVWTRPDFVQEPVGDQAPAAALAQIDSGTPSDPADAGNQPGNRPAGPGRNSVLGLFAAGSVSLVLLWAISGPSFWRRPAWRASGVALLALLALTLIGAPAVIRAAAPSAVTDVNPDGLPGEPRYGGRVRGITISPTSNLVAFAASELGGIFRSTNGGTNWSHIDAIPLTIALDVMFDPQDANIIIASGFQDGGVVNQGGIWRSTDGGFTWAKPATSTPGCNNQASSWGIAIPNDPVQHDNIFVGTDCGLAISDDSGATWTHVDPCSTTDAAFCNNGGTVYDVQARVVGGNIQLDVCSVEGYFRSSDGGTTWSTPDAASPVLTGLNNSPCYVATAPNDANTVYLAHFSGLTPPPGPQFCVSQLLESTSAGSPGSWVDMQVSANNCRDAWVVSQPAIDGDANHFEVYFGDSQRVRAQHCDLASTPRCQTGAGNWPTADSGAHPDPSDITFDTTTANGCPQILSTDGGISTSSDCGANWVDGNRGLHALDIRGLAGTVEAGHTDLYFGTQDNGLYFSQNGAATWSRPVGADVYNVLADHNSPASVFYRQCFGCSNRIGGAHLAGVGGFSNPPGNMPVTAVAAQFGPQSYIFLTNDGGTPALWTAYVTTDAGGTWDQMGPSPLPGNPGEVKAAGPAGSPTFYMRLNVGGQLRIYQLAGALDSSASLTLASNGLVTPSGAWGVDPEDPNFLYATDLGTSQMMFTSDAGAQWDPDPALTNLVTRAGSYRFWPQIGAMVSAVAFDGNSDTIIVGTRTAGLFASVTNGQAWFSIPGAEGLPLFRDAFFDESDGSIYAATQGRGLWLIELPLADLSITKSDSPDPVIAGEQLWYDLTVTNNGPDDATDVVVVDTLPLGVTYQTDTDSCTLSVGTGPGGEDQLTCELGDIPNGESRSFTIQVLVDFDLVANAGGPTTITNLAEVSAAEQGDPDLSDNTASETTLVNELADLMVTKDCKPERDLPAGEEGICTIVVENLGPSTARNVIVEDTYVSNGSFNFGAITTSQGFCSATPNPQDGQGVVTCNLGDLDPGVRVTIRIAVSADAPVDINDRVTVTSDTPDPDLSNNEDEDTIRVRALADLALSKTASPEPVVAGTQLTYELEVTNNGPSDAVNVVILEVLPAGVTIDSVSAPGGSCKSGVPGNADIPTTCALDTLADGDTATMTVVVSVLPGTLGILHNNAMVASDVPDPDNSNNLATLNTHVTAEADLAVTKSDNPDPVFAGQPLAYEVTITNLGPSTAVDVELTDTLPDGVTYTSATVSNGHGTCVLLETPANVVSCDLNDLNPGEFVSVIINVVVNPDVPHGASLVNSATATSNAVDPNPANSTATATTGIRAKADLEILKDGNIDTTNPSLAVVYLIQVNNSGPSDAQNVIVVDSLPLDPQKVVYEFDTGNGACSYSQASHQVTCNFGSLPAGESLSVKIYVKIRGSVGVISNIVQVSTSTADPDLTNNTARKDLLIHG